MTVNLYKLGTMHLTLFLGRIIRMMFISLCYGYYYAAELIKCVIIENTTIQFSFKLSSGPIHVNLTVFRCIGGLLIYKNLNTTWWKHVYWTTIALYSAAHIFWMDEKRLEFKQKIEDDINVLIESILYKK